MKVVQCHMGRQPVNNELETVGRVAVITKYGKLPRYLPGTTKKNHESL